VILSAKNIRKNFGDLSILKGVDFHVEQGTVASIVGSSGAGKTTLLQILGTLEKPDSGELLIDDVNPFQLNEKKLAQFRNQKLGFIFQFHQLLPEFTAVENTMLPALIGGNDKQSSKKRAQELLSRLGLSERFNHKPSQLSGGEQQRVAVCRALMNNPAILFADEPSGNLDTQNARDLHDLFFQLREEMKQTIVIVTHNEELANMADVKWMMKDGAILFHEKS
jgi:lipoprotein-releasing system ATP-binding protein